MQDAKDQQVSTEGGIRSAGSGTGDAAGIFASQQPAEIHPAPALRDSRAQESSAAGLSRRGRAAGGHASARRGTRAESHPALHHAAEGGRSSAELWPGSAVAFGDSGAVPKKSSRPIEIA